MRNINLRDCYPFYTSDFFIKVPDEIAETFITDKQHEAAYQARKQYNKAQYSLDRDDGIENAIIHNEPSAEDTYERESRIAQILAVMETLPGKQAQRLYACYFLGMSVGTIARNEGVSKQVVSTSIRRGLRRIKKILKNPL
ncbi:MAG: sigma factor-like helix-turn-helix DNA-binding protein [Ethanoligenens sp.]